MTSRKDDRKQPKSGAEPAPKLAKPLDAHLMRKVVDCVGTHLEHRRRTGQPGQARASHPDRTLRITGTVVKTYWPPYDNTGLTLWSIDNILCRYRRSMFLLAERWDPYGLFLGILAHLRFVCQWLSGGNIRKD